MLLLWVVAWLLGWLLRSYISPLWGGCFSLCLVPRADLAICVAYVSIPLKLAFVATKKVTAIDFRCRNPEGTPLLLGTVMADNGC